MEGPQTSFCSCGVIQQKLTFTQVPCWALVISEDFLKGVKEDPNVERIHTAHRCDWEGIGLPAAHK